MEIYGGEIGILNPRVAPSSSFLLLSATRNALSASEGFFINALNVQNGILAKGEDFSPCRHLASGCRSTAQMRTLRLQRAVSHAISPP